MEEKLRTMYELCETISRELEEANEKIRKAGGKLSAGDVDYIDKLTHSMKSIKTTIAMMESEDEGEYSNNYWPMPYGRSYAGGSGNRGGGGSGNRGGGGSSRASGGSYARGGRGGRNNNPMGRNQYSREGGYSYADGMEDLISEMREMMDDLPEEKRREVQRFVDKMERM